MAWQAVTIPTTIGGFASGMAYFGNMEMDPNKPIFVRVVGSCNERAGD